MLSFPFSVALVTGTTMLAAAAVIIPRYPDTSGVLSKHASHWGDLPPPLANEPIGAYLNRLLDPDHPAATTARLAKRDLQQDDKLSSCTWTDATSGENFNISISDMRCESGIKPQDKVGTYLDAFGVERDDVEMVALITSLFQLRRTWSSRGTVSVKTAYYKHVYDNLEAALEEVQGLLNLDMVCDNPQDSNEKHPDTMRKLLADNARHGTWISIIYGGLVGGVVGGAVVADWQGAGGNLVEYSHEILEAATVVSGMIILSNLITFYRQRTPQEIGGQEAWVVTTWVAWFRGFVVKLAAMLGGASVDIENVGAGMTCQNPQSIAEAAVQGVADTAVLVSEAAGQAASYGSFANLLDSLESGACR